MAITAPRKRINPTILRRSGVGRKQVYAGLFLTSMVDMFAILVIFLLQSFSAEGELIILPPGLELPNAKNVGTLEQAPSLVISKDKIMFENKVIAKTEVLMNQENWLLPSLQEALKTEAQKRGNKEKPMKQKMNISADKHLPFKVVKKIIYNLGYSGFPDFRFAVLAEGSK